jgi:peptide/nickel transport system substrate-binding protein
LTIGGIGLGILGLVTAAACGSTSTPSSSSGTLASSQVLRFPTFQDPGTWDPGEMDIETDTELMQNVFDNLWRFDDKLNITPDIATAVPTQANGGISADGSTYTVHLNPAAKFSNSDAVTSKDVLYSWNRAAALHGPYS